MEMCSERLRLQKFRIHLLGGDISRLVCATLTRVETQPNVRCDCTILPVDNRRWAPHGNVTSFCQRVTQSFFYSGRLLHRK